MKKILMLPIITLIFGCSASNSTGNSSNSPSSIVTTIKPITTQQTNPNVWQEDFNRQQAEQNRKIRDERFRQEQRTIFEQQQRDNFRRLNDAYKASVTKH